MSNFKPEIPILQKTEDGSHTLLLQNLGETYHSSTGALTESKHVYIDNGYKFGLQNFDKLKILEVGFGTGVNAVLTFEEATKDKISVEYISLEPYPIPLEIAEHIDMRYITQNEEFHSIFMKLHEQKDNEQFSANEYFNFVRMNKTIQEFEADLDSFNVIYYDAFAPRKQPEMWEISILKKCVNLLKRGGIFITYCANGQFKRDLKSLGMELYNPPGIGPRREITRAEKN